MPCPNTRRKVNLKSSIFLFSVIGISLISNISYAEQTALWGEGTTVNQGVPVTLPPAPTQEVAPPDFHEIISKTSTSAIFTGADKFTEELLESISDSGLSSGAISSIARNVKKRLANLNLQSAGASTASFGKDVIVGMLVDFIAEEAMNYQIQRGGNLSTLRAATTYVLIKQGYIVATSKGPAGIIVGQAGLLRDIAIKDIQAIQEYTEAKDIADHAELRSEMWEAYGEYVQAFATATTQTERDLAKQAFNSRLQQISNTWDLNDDIIAPGPGSLDSPGNRPGDIRYENTSELRVLFDETLQQFTSLQETSPLFSEPLPQYDYLGPFQYQVPRDGFIPQYIYFHSAPDIDPITSYLAVNPNTDLTNEQIATLLAGADPNNPTDPVEPTDPTDPTPPPPPTGNLVGFMGAQDFGYSGRVIGFSRHATRLSSVSGSLGQATTLTFNCGTGCSPNVPVTATAKPGFSYLTWGQYSDTNIALPQSNNNYNFSYGSISWLVGVPTTGTDYAKRTGTGYFSGTITGTSLDRRGIDNDYTILPSRGGIDMMVDFGTNKLNGWGYTDRGNFGGTFRRETEFRFSSDISASANEVSYSTDLVGFQTNRRDDAPFVVGALDGLFFGPLTNETGGAIWAGGAGGTVGVFSMGESNFTTSPTYGYLAVHPENRPTVNAEPLELNQFVASTPRFRDGYDHTSWGAWTKEGMILSMDFDQDRRGDGLWVQGDLTPSQDIPRSGSATYNGDAVGRIHNSRDLVTGTVSLDVNFATQNVTSQLDLQSGGSTWVSASGTGRFDTGTANQIHTTGTVNNTSGTMSLGGTFFGPNANEIGGAWGVGNVGTGNLSASGVFRAKQ